MSSHGHATHISHVLPSAAAPYLDERLNDDFVVARRVQLQKTVQKLLKIVSGVDFFLEYHLKHGLPEIFIRIVRIFDDGEAVFEFWTGSHGFGKYGVVRAGGGEMAGFGFGLRLNDIRWLWAASTAAICGENTLQFVYLVGRHVDIRTRGRGGVTVAAGAGFDRCCNMKQPQLERFPKRRHTN
ncbi:hypothetical protein C2S51_004763 [Perilla frutescens var. frutescens]|nr:hypothetical protein C2S51_004763 [Perilla frutescens var. frutescens]